MVMLIKVFGNYSEENNRYQEKILSIRDLALAGRLPVSPAVLHILNAHRY